MQSSMVSVNLNRKTYIKKLMNRGLISGEKHVRWELQISTLENLTDFFFFARESKICKLQSVLIGLKFFYPFERTVFEETRTDSGIVSHVTWEIKFAASQNLQICNHNHGNLRREQLTKVDRHCGAVLKWNFITLFRSIFFRWSCQKARSNTPTFCSFHLKRLKAPIETRKIHQELTDAFMSNIKASAYRKLNFWRKISIVENK